MTYFTDFTKRNLRLKKSGVLGDILGDFVNPTLVANSKISKMYSAKGNESLVQVLAPRNNIINIAAAATHTKAVSTATRFELVQRKPVEGSSVSAVVASTTAIIASSAVQDLSKPSRKGTMGILREARVVLHRLTAQQLEDAGYKSTRPTTTQILARKSLDKAKHNVAASNKLLASATVNETTESLNVHVNPNTATLTSKSRFATAGSSGSSSSSSNQFVSMTRGKPVANIVPDIGTFTCTKPVGMMPTKATGENELKRKELKLKQLKRKEDEAARKCEESLKAKEQKRKHDGRIGQEKLEDKGERSAHLKQRVQAGNQEKAKRQTEVEKAKTGAVADVAVAGPSTMNTTVTLPSSLTLNYQITPVHVTKNGKPFNPDNYDIGDLRSDDSPDKWYRPKKTIPTWARSSNFIVPLEQQMEADINPDQIFPKEILLKDPNLNEMFENQRECLNKRSSSGIWETRPSN
ncbi:hypothetical protein DAPPUDRAFT_237130 [Daphnia pulex]|uniref:Inner centromere protein ARK-binding domain-containing protein n=1 Tax=Daphnia pulex TaxID=6669 RepID=E9G487_DAPPU|nr:hypothetical protein DAPPUDRAFT_237130 [Daphnia pulex]|eukprot:EFX86054.1 hypothetical protein DAPPUDRAFT_237130 [Daphnia pulex]